MQNVIIFGAGNAGLAAYENIQGQYLPVAFCDNDESKVGTNIHSLPVLSPNQLSSFTFDLVLIASEYFEQIKQQLEVVQGIAASKIKVLSASQIKGFHIGDNQQSRERSENVLFALCQVFRELSLKYHIDAGTLLGIYRDDSLIPWDDDLDFAIPSEMVDVVRQNQQVILGALNANTQVEWGLTEHVSTKDFGLVKRGDIRSFKLEAKSNHAGLPLVDLFVKYLDETTMDYVISSRGFSMPSEHMQSVVSHDFKGQSLMFPFNVDGYLTKHYGDWRTPKPEWNLSELKNATVF